MAPWGNSIFVRKILETDYEQDSSDYEVYMKKQYGEKE